MSVADRPPAGNGAGEVALRGRGYSAAMIRGPLEGPHDDDAGGPVARLAPGAPAVPAPPAAARPRARSRAGADANGAAGRAGLRGSGWGGAALAFALYAAVSAAAYGAQVLPHLGSEVVGSGQSEFFSGRDQGTFTWALAWVEHALVHLQNPILTNAVFAPRGYNLAWSASILLPGLVTSPLTAIAGAVPAFNVLALTAPPVAGLAAFLLCRELSGSFAAALAGGLLYGFSSYETAEMINHLNLALIAGAPLAGLLVARRARGRTTRRRYVAGLAAVLAAQLWTSTEVFASLLVFGAIGFAAGFALAGSAARRQAAARLAGESALALPLVLVLGAPLLYHVIRYPNPLSGHPQAGVGADLAGLVIPTQAIWLHGHGGTLPTGSELAGNITEQGLYLGPVLIGLLIAFGIEFHRKLLGRLLITMMLLALIASLGSHLLVVNHDTSVWLPWSLAGELPFIRYAIPARFALYLWLAVALATALWLAQRRARGVRWLTFALVVLSLVPSPSFRWASRVDRPPLLESPSLLARYVPAGATVLALPFGEIGSSMDWQAEAGFRFRLAGGYLGWALPAPYAGLSVIHELTGQPPGGRLEARLCRFTALTGTSIILVRTSQLGYFPEELASLHARVRRVGGFLVYDLRGPATAASCRRAIAAAGPTR